MVKFKSRQNYLRNWDIFKFENSKIQKPLKNSFYDFIILCQIFHIFILQNYIFTTYI